MCPPKLRISAASAVPTLKIASPSLRPRQYGRAIRGSRWVNKSVLWWDDGAEKNTYVVDNNYELSRFGFKGSAKIGGDWSAGYRMEIETITAQSNLVNQFDP